MTAIDVPAAWGTTRIAEIRIPGDAAAIELPPWCELMLPASDGTYHHGTEGSIAPDTLALALDSAAIALADIVPLYTENLYAADAEYLLAIRLREVLDLAAWQRLPWSSFRPPTVIYAVDKFHHSTWPRLPETPCVMSHGGGWDDLQYLADHERPPASTDPPWCDRTLGPSDGAMLRAVHRSDIPWLRDMLARGGNLLAGVEAPDVYNGVAIGASWPMHSSLLVTAVLHSTTQVLEILLAAGAPIDHRIGDGWPALHSAVANQRRDHVETLLRHGADPRIRTAHGDAIDLARQYAPALVEPLTAAASAITARTTTARPPRSPG